MRGQSCKWIVMLGLLGAYPDAIHAGWWDTRFDLPGANGAIQSLVEFRGALYAVGYFTRIDGIDAPGVARWDGTRWTALHPIPKVNVWGAVATEDALYFAVAYGQSEGSGLLRWDGQGWTALGSPPDYQDLNPRSLLAVGPEVYCEAYPIPSPFPPSGHELAKWNANGWTNVAVIFSYGGPELTSLAYAQGNIYAAGSFWGLNLGRLAPPGWQSVGGGFGAGFFLMGQIASDGTNLFVQGTFTSVGGHPADGFAVWTGSEWIAPPASSRGGTRVVALTSNAGEVLASEEYGTNTASGDHPFRQYLVQYRGTDRTVLTRADIPGVQLMRRTPDGIYCTGQFRAVGNRMTGNLVLWDGSSWSRVGPVGLEGLDNQVTSLAAGGANVYAAGDFQYAGEAHAHHLARWDGRRWYALGSGVDGTVTQIATRGDDLFVIGNFTSVGGINATNVAKWDGSAWSSLGPGFERPPTALAVSQHYLWVARDPSYTNAVIERWDGTNWTGVSDGSFSGVILTMVASDSRVIAGGRFDKIDGVLVNHIARWENGKWHALGDGLSGQAPWEPEEFPFSEVRALLLDGTNLYAGGSFTNAGQVAAMNVARWDGKRWWAMGKGLPGFGICELSYRPSCIYPVTSLAMVDGGLFASGGFLARWDGTAWVNVGEGNWSLDWGRSADASNNLHVWALASRGNDLYVGGNFGIIANVPSYGFGLWHDEPSPVLHARLVKGILTLSWPRQFQDATLETTGSLKSPTWTRVTGIDPPANWSGTGDVEVTLPVPRAQAFYRLHWPE